MAPPNEKDDGDEEDPELLAKIAAAEEHVKSHEKAEAKESKAQAKDAKDKKDTKDGAKGEAKKDASKGKRGTAAAAQDKDDQRGHTEVCCQPNVKI